MSQKPDLGVVNSAVATPRGQFLAKKGEEKKDQASTQKRGNIVASMISVFNNASSNNSQEPLTRSPVRSRTPVPTSSPLHPRLRSSSSSPKVISKFQPHPWETSAIVKPSTLGGSLPQPRNKVTVTSSKTTPVAGLLADSKNPRVQRTLELFNKGGVSIGQQKSATTLRRPSGVDSPSRANMREASQKSCTLPSRSNTTVADSCKRNGEAGTSTRATPANITICSSKNQPTTRTRSCTSPFTSSTSSDEEGVGVNPKVVVEGSPGELFHNTKRKLGSDETTSCSTSRSSSAQSCHEFTEETPSDKQSATTPHATYILSHSPSPSPSTGSLNSSEPPSPSTRPCTVKQPGGIWFTTEVSPTSPNSEQCLPEKPWGVRRCSSGSTPGCGRRKIPSPLPSQPGGTLPPSGSKSSMSKSHSAHTLSSTSRNPLSLDSTVKAAELQEQKPHKDTVQTSPIEGRRARLKPLSSSSFRTAGEKPLPPMRRGMWRSGPRQRSDIPPSAGLPKKNTCAVTILQEPNSSQPAMAISSQRKSEQQQVQNDHLTKHPKTVPPPKLLTNSTSHQSLSHGNPPPNSPSPNPKDEEKHQDQDEMEEQDKCRLDLERSGNHKPKRQVGSPDVPQKVSSSHRNKAKPSRVPLEHEQMSVKSRIALFKSMQQVDPSQRTEGADNCMSKSCPGSPAKSRMVKMSPVSSPNRAPLQKRDPVMEKNQSPAKEEVSKHNPDPHQIVESPTIQPPAEQKKKASNNDPNNALSDEDEEELTLTVLKITSGKVKQGEEESIQVEVFDTATQSALSTASTVARGSVTCRNHEEIPTLSSVNGASQTYSSQTETGFPSQASKPGTGSDDDDDYDDVIVTIQLPQEKQKLTPPLNNSQLSTVQEQLLFADEEYDDVIFSHKPRSPLTPPSTAVVATGSSTELVRRGLPLESIPEYDVADTSLTPLPSEGAPSTIAAGASDKEHSSSDSENEFYRQISTVTSSFYDEMLASITATIGSSRLSFPPQQQGSMGEKEFTHAVDQLVQQNPELAGPIYESIEQYKRRSHFIIQSGFDDKPPALPPRPDNLSRPNQERSKIHSISTSGIAKTWDSPFETYVQMKSSILPESSVTSSASSSVDPTSIDYEPVHFNPSHKKRHKSPKRSKSTKKQAEKEKKEPGRKRIGSRTDDTRQAVKKKGRLHGFFSRSGKTEEAKPGSLPGSYKFSVGSTDEEAFLSPSMTDYEILHAAAPQYRNVGRSLSLSAPTGHTYGNFGGEHAVFISPTHSSESEDDNDSQLQPSKDDENQSRGSQESSKLKSSDSLPPTFTGISSQTPDSGVYPELSPTHITRRYARDPLTPPLYTKLSVSSSTGSSCSLPLSSSDPSIHSTLLTDSKKRKHAGLEHKDTPSPTGSLTKFMDLALDSGLDSTSFDSSRGGERMWQSPVARKRSQSVSPEKLKGAVQKEQLLAHTRRKESIPETSEVGVYSIAFFYKIIILKHYYMYQCHSDFGPPPLVL